ncbi:MAG: ABC transporter substrate-binding protein [Betaproteobacteria bacterium]|nr:ABC transporter substrate-binding protein [Betaproteobacteria bacterium]
MRLVAVFFAAATTLCATDAGAAALSIAEERGREIYLNGKSPSGRDITALVGQGLVATPATGLPCGSCHGPDGLGRPEGGVVPSNITWGYLTKPYGTLSTFGQRRPAYTADTLARAIRLGIDSADKRLDVSMPRYRMAQEDIEDLIAYLKRLETYLDPGLSNDRIILGTILPGPGPLHSLGQSMRAVVEAHLDSINAQGGIYGRKLELDAREAAGTKAVREAAKNLGKRAFALVSVFTAGADDEYAELAEDEGLPTIGPFTLFNQDENSLRRFTFHLFGGLPVQARVLAEYAARKLRGQKPSTAVIYPADPQWAAIAQTVENQAAGQGWPIPLPIRYARGQISAGELARRLKGDGIEAVFFFGSPAELVSLTREAERMAWTPYVFLPGSLAGKEIFDVPAVFQDKIFLAYATIPSDHTPAAVTEFSALRRGHALSEPYLLAQISAYAATKVLVEGLKRAGRGLSREKLIAALEKMYDYETGLTPKLTYGPNRRIGALGAHMIAVDLAKREFKVAGEWIELKPK